MVTCHSSHRNLVQAPWLKWERKSQFSGKAGKLTRAGRRASEAIRMALPQITRGVTDHQVPGAEKDKLPTRSLLGLHS